MTSTFRGKLVTGSEVFDKTRELSTIIAIEQQKIPVPGCDRNPFCAVMGLVELAGFDIHVWY